MYVIQVRMIKGQWILTVEQGETLVKRCGFSGRESTTRMLDEVKHWLRVGIANQITASVLIEYNSA